jgi:hypothetical protein
MGRIGGFERIGHQKLLEVRCILEEFPVAWKEFEFMKETEFSWTEL